MIEPRATHSHLRSVSITGVGSCVPDRVLSNADLERMVETSDEWIVTRTGIRERRIAADSQTTSDLATEAARRAMASAGVSAQQIDLIICHHHARHALPQHRMSGPTPARCLTRRRV